MVGVAGFEPATSCSQSRRANRAAPHPDITESDMIRISNNERYRFKVK